jgi:hypothetical protein
MDRRKPRLSPEEIADLCAPVSIACPPWLSPEAVSASLAKDVTSRNGHTLENQTRATRNRLAHEARLKAQATARANGSRFNFHVF